MKYNNATYSYNFLHKNSGTFEFYIKNSGKFSLPSLTKLRPYACESKSVLLCKLYAYTIHFL